MALTITKRGNPKQEFNKKVMDNLEKVGREAGLNAQIGVPVDRGDLRNSLTQRMEGTTFVNNWSVIVTYSKGTFDYSTFRYNHNEKNPNKTHWAEKDFERHKKQYLRKIAPK